MSEVIGIPPMYANLPSCKLYIRAGASSGTGIKDWSLGKKTVTNNGSVSMDGTQKFPPGSIHIDGTDAQYLSLSGSYTDLSFGSNPFIISVLLRPISWKSNSWTGIICKRQNSSVGEWEVVQKTYGGVNQIGFAQNGTTFTYYNWNPSLPAWYNLIISGDSTTIAMYIDNVSLGTPMSRANMPNSSAIVNIGGETGSSGVTYYGNMDEIGIWVDNGSSGPIPTHDQLYAISKTRRFIV